VAKATALLVAAVVLAATGTYVSVLLGITGACLIAAVEVIA
jgi:hypothetical protein